MAIKRVAVIGAGPAGAIAVDALSREKKFDLIRGFERREGPGGCWIGDSSPPPPLTNFEGLADRTVDTPLQLPENFPAVTPKSDQPRWTESSIYPYLETNVADLPMQFTQEPIPEERSQWSIQTHGSQTPFRHWKVLRGYIQRLLSRNDYENVFVYSTTVERAEKIGDEWRLVLRQQRGSNDYWWVESFDAIVVASGHYSVPYIPKIEGLEDFGKSKPGSVLHSKCFRGRDQFKGKRVVVVGASVSAADIAFDLTSTAKSPVHAVVIGHTLNGYFGGEAFNHPRIQQQPSIARILGRTVHFIDGNTVSDVDHIIFGTGYSWTVPFLPQVLVRNNRVPDLYQHVVWRHDSTLMFVGAVGAGMTFKIFEWQAVYAARLLAGRGTLPSAKEMQKWEENRIKEKGDGPKFTLVFPDFEQYFEEVRRLAGEPENGVGRKLPKYDQEWHRVFIHGHELRKDMWLRINEEARAKPQDRANL